jgi:hypothetical protein
MSHYRDGASMKVVKENPSKVFHYIGDRSKPESYKAAVKNIVERESP